MLVLVAALVVKIVSKETWLFLPEISFTAAMLTILGCLSYLQINKKVSLLINEALDSLVNGVIYFDRSGAMVRFNPAAAFMLPNISDDKNSENFIGTYKKFLAYVYDHSLDIQDQSKLTLDFPNMNLSKLLFREVVGFNHRMVLVQLYQRDTMDIVSVLTDISMMKRHIDEIAHDFNNILSVIDGFTKLTQKGIEKGTDITSFFENIDRNVQRGTKITDRLLAFGQRRVTQKIRFDICEHIKSIGKI